MSTAFRSSVLIFGFKRFNTQIQYPNILIIPTFVWVIRPRFSLRQGYGWTPPRTLREPINPSIRLINCFDYEPNRVYIRLMKYNWQYKQWPEFEYDKSGIEGDLLTFADLSGQISGVVKGLGSTLQVEAVVDVMIAEAIKSSEIEGAYLSRPDVASSIRNCLGLKTDIRQICDPASQGVAELMVDSRNSWDEELSEVKLLEWHRMLMKGSREIEVGCWRSHAEEMQVVSGSIGAQKVLYSAPPSEQVAGEMSTFIGWFNSSTEKTLRSPVRSAIAHLYFESIHPFEDGNGRIGRVIAEKALSQGLGRPVLLSLSRTINQHRSDYYAALGEAQRSLEITPWVEWFVKMAIESQKDTYIQVDFTLKKTRFFDRFKNEIHERQMLVVQRMLKEGPSGFEGGMNARKYVALTKVSKATATRDIQNLVEKGVLIPIGGGRSTRYELSL